MHLYYLARPAAPVGIFFFFLWYESVLIIRRSVFLGVAAPLAIDAAPACFFLFYLSPHRSCLAFRCKVMPFPRSPQEKPKNAFNSFNRFCFFSWWVYFPTFHSPLHLSNGSTFRSSLMFVLQGSGSIMVFIMLFVLSDTQRSVHGYCVGKSHYQQ